MVEKLNGITGGKAFIVIFEEPGYSPYDETYTPCLPTPPVRNLFG